MFTDSPLCAVAHDLVSAPTPMAVLPLAAPDVALEATCTPSFTNPVLLDPSLLMTLIVL